MRKGQFAFEFVVLVSFVIIFTSIFLVIIENDYAKSQQLKHDDQINKVMRIINTEVDLAEASPGGYQRTFYLPTAIDGTVYNVSSSDNIDVIFDYNQKTYVYFLPNTTLENAKGGVLKPGSNTIYKNCTVLNSKCRVELIS